MDKEIYSAIDASINRALEGLRVCEDAARFSLRISDCSARLKELRHRVRDASARFPRELLLLGRDVESDSQKFVDLPGELSRGSLESLFTANLHRAMEAVRSLEEFSKLAPGGGGENPFQEIRFSLYALERDVVPLLMRESRLVRFTRSIFAIINPPLLEGEEYRAGVMAMINGGAAVIQLRMKQEGRREILSAAERTAEICRGAGALFILNGNPDIAVLSGADGVHLDRFELGVADIRRIVPPHMIVGITVHTPVDAERAAAEGADYISVGPIYDTEYSDEEGPVLHEGAGIDIISDMREAASIPLIAFGGITPERAGEVIAAGADSVAASSYLSGDGGIEQNCRTLLDSVRGA